MQHRKHQPRASEETPTAKRRLTAQHAPHLPIARQERQNPTTHIGNVPADVLSYVFELAVSRLEELAPLARVSKLFNACVKRQSVLRGLDLRTHERLQRINESQGREAAGDALLETLQQVRSAYPTISGISLGDRTSSFRYRQPAYVENKHLHVASTFPCLKSLETGNCRRVPGGGFACLSSLTSLHDMDVRGTNINDESLAGLSRSLTALTKLNLWDCQSISGRGFACLSSLTSLHDLDVRGTNINDESLAGLSRSLTALTKLNLWDCQSISGRGFACLSSLTSLHELDVRGTNINDEGLAVLSRSLTALTALLSEQRCFYSTR